MPESIVQVNSGSGPKLHSFQRTIGANSVEDEVVLPGEPYLAGYTVAQGGTSISTATVNSHLLQVMAGSSLKVRIRRIEVHQQTVATTVAFMALAIYRLSTAGTGGVVHTPSALDPTDAASGASAMSLPSAKGTEGVVLWNGTAHMLQTLTAGNDKANPVFSWDADLLRTKPIMISAGTSNGIALKNLSAVAGATVWVAVIFDETSF